MLLPTTFAWKGHFTFTLEEKKSLFWSKINLNVCFAPGNKVTNKKIGRRPFLMLSKTMQSNFGMRALKMDLKNTRNKLSLPSLDCVKLGISLGQTNINS